MPHFGEKRILIWCVAAPKMCKEIEYEVKINLLELPMVKCTSKKTLVTALMLSSLCASTYADDGVYRLRVGESRNTFTTLFSGGDMKTSYNSLNLGLSYIMPSGWYLDGAVKQSIGAYWNSVEVTNQNGQINDGKNNQFNRTDYTFTAGKALGDGWTAFGGYQESNSNISIPRIWPTTNHEETLKAYGYFGGISKSIPLSTGTISLNLAGGLMRALITDSAYVNHGSNVGFGTSYSATYTYPLDQETNLNFDYKKQSYTYNFAASNMALTSGKDKMLQLGVGISRQF